MGNCACNRESAPGTYGAERLEGPRGCGPYDVGPAMDLLNRIFFPEEPAVGGLFPHLMCEANRENMRIIKVDGRIVAHSGLYVAETTTPRGTVRLGSVWGVCCHPDFRRRGFGEQVVADCMARMRDLGCEVGWLATGVNDWYRKLGWENAGQGYSFELDRGNIGLLPELTDCQLQEGLWLDLEEMLALHEADKLGCLRTAELFEVLVRRPQVRAYAASRNGRLAAYALTSDRGVGEYAGEPEVVAGLMRWIFALRDPPSAATSTTPHLARLQVETPVQAEGLPGLLRRMGIPCRFGPRGMMWIANLRGLLEKLNLGEIAVEEGDREVRLHRGSETATLAPRMVIKLFFGPERVCEFASDRLPVPFYQWELDTV